MPTAQATREALASSTSEWVWLAIGWHIVFVFLVVSGMMGWRPSRLLAGMLLPLPLLSVSLVAAIASSPFNAVVPLILCVALQALARRLDAGPVKVGHWGSAAFGMHLVVFGLVYPHFLAANSLLEYAYAAPTGVIRCPTLCVVIGLAIVLNGLGSRLYSVVFAVGGLFYGLFGWLRLGVTIDVTLAAGSLTLLGIAIRQTAGRRE